MNIDVNNILKIESIHDGIRTAVTYVNNAYEVAHEIFDEPLPYFIKKLYNTPSKPTKRRTISKNDNRRARRFLIQDIQNRQVSKRGI